MTNTPDNVAAARERFAADLDGLRGSFREELGWAPRGFGWVVPIVALAAGVVAGMALKRNLPRLMGSERGSARPRRLRR
jgi:hypothetical protein